ncbi:MAG: M20/M25/M40 family metallo-hydrolase, partial [Lachnospiraceae bacterium]|nr:M20/M25/M40 family metallo-hydrolase [Lachnospiraceae bacterium]
RVPVTVAKDELLKAVEPYLENEKGRVEVLGIGGPLFFPKDSPLVHALYDAYTEITGDTAHEPMVIGGGTYAKALPGIIAFGPEMPDVDYHIHNANEFLIVPEYLQSVEIYLKAIENMLEI